MRYRTKKVICISNKVNKNEGKASISIRVDQETESGTTSAISAITSSFVTSSTSTANACCVVPVSPPGLASLTLSSGSSRIGFSRPLRKLSSCRFTLSSPASTFPTPGPEAPFLHAFASPTLASPPLVYSAPASPVLPSPAPASAISQLPVRAPHTIASPTLASPAPVSPALPSPTVEPPFPIHYGSPSPHPVAFAYPSFSPDAPVHVCCAIPSALQPLPSAAPETPSPRPGLSSAPTFPAPGAPSAAAAYLALPSSPLSP